MSKPQRKQPNPQNKKDLLSVQRLVSGRSLAGIGSQLLPDSFNSDLKFSSTFTITPALGVGSSHSFRLNSLYDPDFTGVGIQPYGFDEMMKLYKFYQVMSVEVFIHTAAFEGNQSSNGIFIAASPTTTNIPVADPAAVASSPFSQHWAGYVQTYDKHPWFRRHYNLWTLFGRDKRKYFGADEFQSTAGDNPADVMYLQVCANTLDETSGSVVRNVVTINYRTIFTVRKQLAMS